MTEKYPTVSVSFPPGKPVVWEFSNCESLSVGKFGKELERGPEILYREQVQVRNRLKQAQRQAELDASAKEEADRSAENDAKLLAEKQKTDAATAKAAGSMK